MKLKGERIELRPAVSSDAEVILVWENNPDHWLVSNTTEPYTLTDVVNFLEFENNIFDNRQTRFMIMQEDGLPAGCIDLFEFDPRHHRVGVGILIDPAYRQRGYATEALELAVEYCLDVLEVNCVYADVLCTNISSVHLFEKCGFLKSGVKREWLWDGQSFVDQYFYQRFE